MQTTYAALAGNRWRTIWLLMLFPAMVATVTYLASLAVGLIGAEGIDGGLENGSRFFLSSIPFVTIGSVLWMIIALFAGRKMVLSFAGAKKIQKADAPDLYRTVENLAIQTGIPTPDVYVIEDESMNAFATGYRPENAAVAITRGLLNKLTKPELEAVMAHEMGHILHRDTRVMLMAVTMVGIIQLITELVLRGVFRSSFKGNHDRKGGGSAAAIAIILVIVIWLIGAVGAVFVQMGISRRREYMADAQSAHLTRHPDALITALQKIATDSRVEVLDGKRSVAAMCIIDPLGQNKHGFFDAIGGLFASHPPMEKRIETLKTMA